ncbi:hypothetical protein [Bacillus sp. 3255]|uniref:hypothetical protein n=1 Tax=Bacillus sp. 3255 TaxID=2817904 RepID=UPI0028567EC9|nr:hypothetical protein [Bacillus sp. 3255]MDR6883803.1 Na+-translocating ferredoxin:NAD+ oxidoreductase RnfG subunit [Bacillus sp. 3255]
MATPTTPNLGLNKVDRSSPTTTYFNTKTLIDDNMDAIDAKVAPIHNPVFTGNGITLPADPTAVMHAVTLQWALAQLATAKKYAP